MLLSLDKQTMTMMIPPFPSQDLAKLVLGYLAEEQLMTAYDEFLQASPYLDALSNEYDRIFMTSLKNILAEYRAVRIYVETCKPHSLRRRLFGCTNLLEVIKYLIQNVDVTKINVPQATTHKTSVDNTNVSVLSKSTFCEVCSSLKLSACACKARQASQHSSQVEETTLESSLETTALEDLPGNQVTTRSKQTNSPEKDSQTHLSLSSCDKNVGLSLPQGSNVSLTANQQFVNNNLSQCQGVFTKKPVNESNHVMPDYSNLRLCGNNVTETNKSDYSTSTASSFQEFPTGVYDVANNQTCMNVPDSSTSENANSVIPLNKEGSLVSTDSNGSHLKEISKAHIFLKVGTVSNRDSNNMINQNSSTPTSVFRKILPIDQKVTILSDIKVDKTYANDSSDNMPPVLRNAATSTPVMQMQTIVINGTPVYKQDHQISRSKNFSQDEIMSMPTIILVPTSAPTKVTSVIPFTSGVHTKNVNPPIIQPLNPAIFTTSTISQSYNLNVNTLRTSQSIISDNISSVNTIMPDSNEPSVKTIENKNATVPKDNVIDCPNRTTPHALPPTRKSSSTPRRTSHIRVLDFTTPRRILQETINEQVCDNCNTRTETLISQSPNIHTIADSTANVSAQEKGSDANNIQNKTIKSNSTTPVFVKKSNWDEDLRAMAIANQNDSKRLSAKPKRNTKKKKKIDSKDKDVETPKSTKKNKPLSNVVSGAKSKSKRKSEPIDEVIEIIDDTPIPPVKPTINIISGSDWNTISPKVDDKEQNKSNSDETVDTPDMDRNSLQNVIGAKLNISELLETPYKQALYDIQMDTPKFIGLDLPDEPISDIKIMNIPTPLYLTTPKPVHTPSSYSSRPTDYSSSSSYYKPEDCIIPDLSYPSTSSKEKAKDSNPKVLNEHNETKEKTHKLRESSRPVRKCTKNVSYYNSPNVNKAKDADETSKEGSTCSDLINKFDKSMQKTKLKPRTKSDSKKETATKKRKTPMKKGSANPFMKIKPRRLTPSKVGGKPKKSLPEPEARKRTSSKEKSTTLSVSSSTKSRRKSSTPRKLHCNKSFTSESSGHESPEMILKMCDKQTSEPSASREHDFIDEQPRLLWSDDDVQVDKSNQISVRLSPCNDAEDGEDIRQIKEYIEKSSKSIKEMSNEKEHSLHIDLVKRGFDLETAKILERDLDTSDSVQISENIKTHVIQIERTETEKVNLEANAQSDGTATSNLHIAEDEDEEYVIELSMHDCNEETENYIVCSHEETKNIPKRDMETLKDKFSMEVCLDEDEVIRLRATPFTLILDEEPSDKEIEAAVNSISNMEKLYTPMKDSIRAQCYTIFDSTLTSLDTPLKANSPCRKDVDITVTEIVLHVEEVDEEKVKVKQEVDSKKRKRAQSSNTSDDAIESKRNKQEPHNYNIHDIQDIDIETVLYKLHGP